MGGNIKMATEEITRVPQQEDIAHKALTMALSILVERVQRLPKEDRDDLFQLAKELPNASSNNDIESIFNAMQEILEQAPVRLQALDQTSEPEPGTGLQKWMDYTSSQIRAHRKQAGLTQEQLAERSGLPQSHISRLEGGKHSPSRATLEKIAAALGLEAKVFDPMTE